MTIPRLTAIIAIFVATTLGWFILGDTLSFRSSRVTEHLGDEVRQVWGPGLVQPHLSIVADSASSEVLLPGSSHVDVKLHSDPQKRGLLWHRTYDVDFHAQYEIANTSTASKNIRVQLRLPSKNTSYDNFTFQLGDSGGKEVAPHDGLIETVTLVPAGTTLPLTVAYKARGIDRWAYSFAENTRVKNFTLSMVTDFDDISFPTAATSPTRRAPGKTGGWELTWDYKDVIDARDIGMDMPTLLNAGPVIARITFYAPVSLFFFTAVLVIAGILRGVNLHPMTHALLAAGFFSFHLLLAYLGDLMPLYGCFIIAALISLGLVCGYVRAVAGKEMTVIALVAQGTYMILFSYSFFFEGLTGLTLTITGVTTLALLMFATAKVNWETLFETSGWSWKKKATA
jgi:hypothetical protein